MKNLLAIAALCGLATAIPIKSAARVGSKPAAGSLARREHKTSPYNANLKRKYHSKRGALDRRQTDGSETIIDDLQIRFLAEISMNDQTFNAILDTGSSDTWIITEGYTCIDPSTKAETDTSSCQLGPAWSPDSTFSAIDDVNFFSPYGDGSRYVAGPLGYSPVTLAGLTLPSTIVGAPDVAAWIGTGEESGLIGLAFSPLTSEYSGTDPSQDGSSNYLGYYDSLMTAMFVDYTFDPPLDPLFAFAISRDVSGSGSAGTFSIGGIPDPSDPTVNADSTAYSAAFEDYSSIPGEFSYYAISIDGVTVDGTDYDANIQVVIDTGAPGIYIPADAADAFNAGWSPAGELDSSSGSFIVDCDATPLAFAANIGGGSFTVNPLDLVMNLGGGTCISAVNAVSDATSGIYILGDPFLKNVLAVFDWGNEAMEFYARSKYDS